jgi:hypothetical protein
MNIYAIIDTGLNHRVHRGRDEIGGVYLPSQLERTMQLVRDGKYSERGVGRYSDYDVFLENDEGSRVYRCKKLF